MGISNATVTITNTIDATSTEVFAAVAPLRERFLRLKVGGPAIDAGDNDYLKNGIPADTDDDTTTDAAGNMRIRGRPQWIWVLTKVVSTHCPV